MFQAVILASLTSLGLGGNDVLLRAISRETRAVVAQILESETGTLLMEGNRLVSVSDLLKSASNQEGLSPEMYLERLQLEGREGGLYGGGPELTVLSNVLRRPISIYELLPPDDAGDPVITDKDGSANESASTTSISTTMSNNTDDTSTKQQGSLEMPIQCMGVFGGDRFSDPCANIPDSAILVPGLQPGAFSWHLHILVLDVSSTGEKHACVLLPQ